MQKLNSPSASTGPLTPAVYAIALAAVVAQSLPRDLWYDEAYTLVAYVYTGPLYALTHYRVPNNHILYSTLLGVMLEILPTLPDLLVRSLSAGFAAIAVLLTIRVTGLLLPRAPRASRAIMVLSLYLATPAFLTQATAIRGYALSMALTAGAFALLAAGPLVDSWRRSAAYALLGAVSIGVVPTNLFVFACLALVDGWRLFVGDTRRRPVRWALVHGGVLLGLLLYVPLWKDVLFNLEFGWGVAAERAIPLALLGVLPAGLVGLVAAPRLRRSDWSRAGLATVRTLALSFVLLSVALIVMRLSLFPRVLAGFVPLCVAGIAVLALEAFSLRPRALAAAALTVAIAGQVIWQGSVNWLITDGRTPLGDLSPGYYMARDFDPWATIEVVRDELARHPDAFVVIDNRPWGSDGFSLEYYAMLAEIEGSFVNTGPTPRYPEGGLGAAYIVISRELDGRDYVCESFKLATEPLVQIKERGFFKIWRSW